ncbi:hypothetical protein OBBRIDRAFT_341132 [Obba rivulosa]|uniref:Uncharacterized protein n=1 Tax=Obba rivulosa TaxID=1052685 RepID=A0A8E2AJ19_9APHY|nr:hypothetical protein OBBRIDRAFT_341132 [Obba rivulosa]
MNDNTTERGDKSCTSYNVHDQLFEFVDTVQLAHGHIRFHDKDPQHTLLIAVGKNTHPMCTTARGGFAAMVAKMKNCGQTTIFRIWRRYRVTHLTRSGGALMRSARI